MHCLWCKRPTGAHEPEEHIFPHSLGCPDALIFRNGEVCGRCNGRNARLDHALVGDFEVFRFLFGVPNKKGKPPSISTRANAKGRYVDGEPRLIVNMDPTPVSDELGDLAPLRPTDDLRMSIIPHGMAECEMTLSPRGLCQTKTALRALHKVALSLFALQYGMEGAQSARYDAVRRYVLAGDGERTSLMFLMASGMEYRNEPFKSSGAVFPAEVIAFRLVTVGFFIDLSPTQEHLADLKSLCSRMLEGRGWTWAPCSESSD
jgi:hypothetical protein